MRPDRIVAGGESKSLPMNSGEHKHFTQATSFRGTTDSPTQLNLSGLLGDSYLGRKMIEESFKESEGFPEGESLRMLNGLLEKRWPNRAVQLREG